MLFGDAKARLWKKNTAACEGRLTSLVGYRIPGHSRALGTIENKRVGGGYCDGRRGRRAARRDTA